MNDCVVTQATEDNLDLVASLFNDYRQFYGQADEADKAKRFVRDRLTNQDSVIFLASVNDQAAGFTQLYPSFSSVAMQRIWILNDLFVARGRRRLGVATRLLREAADFALKTSAARLVLATAVDNSAAKSLYQQAGWKRDENFEHYQLSLS